MNDRIRAPEIRLIGAEGENLGVVSPERALDLAVQADLDLVEISPNATPPVCKIMDFGKFKYEQQKRESEARKKQKTIEVKEVKLRPGTDDHDFDRKVNDAVKFLENGDKVKITLRFRGREMAHQNLGRDLLERVAERVEGTGKIESMPKMEGRQMVMMINPVKYALGVKRLEARPIWARLFSYASARLRSNGGTYCKLIAPSAIGANVPPSQQFMEAPQCELS
mgnify:CR=1 FL=1